MSMIAESTELTSHHLRSFFAGDLFAIVVRGYYNLAENEIIDRIERHQDIEEYHYITTKDGETTVLPFGVKRLGVPFSTSFGKSRDSQERQRYYEAASSGITRLRHLFSPYISPIDKLRLELDEFHQGGAAVGRWEGDLMFTGIIRITEPDCDLLEKKPHVDAMTSDFKIDEQFSANIYLDVPESGGELLIFPKTGHFNQEEIHDISINEKLWSENLGDPLVIQPRKGDLIIIRTQIPHAVRSFKEGRRISVQSFLALDSNNRIQMWC